ncbi:MAG TPA: hypothetical protein VEB63_02275 [Chitinophagaceae bacterium]|nr:hypothetical protein [Chitinophagaceae bacterium]
MKSLSTLLLSALAVLFVSCQKENLDELAQRENQITPPPGYTIPACVTATETALLGGQTTTVGTVLIWNDATNVYVSYMLSGNYRVRRTHLYVGACNAIPVNGAGNPRIGLYPYQTDHGTGGTDIYTYTIPRNSLPGGSICVSAHAEVVAFTNGSMTFNETGWAQGDQINDGGSWAMKVSYVQQDCSGGGGQTR